jgi:hypothetical protein
VLEPYLFSEEKKKVEPPADVVVDGDIVRAHVSAPAECPHYLKGQCSFGEKCKFKHTGNVVQDNIRCATLRRHRSVRTVTNASISMSSNRLESL